MAAQCVGFSLLFISCLLGLASPAPLSSVTSLEAGNEVLDPVKPGIEVASDDLTPLSGDIEDRTPLADDVNNDEDAPKSYVDASVFRHVAPASTADAVKPKPSLFVKKNIFNFNKSVKKGREMKEDVSVPSDKLEPPVGDEKGFDVEVDIEEGAVREIVVTEVDAMTTPTTMASSGTNEDSELPRLSPPIWLHSSMAEAMSDPLRLPMIEPYDRYDRYSHSIARDALW